MNIYISEVDNGFQLESRNGSGYSELFGDAEKLADYVYDYLSTRSGMLKTGEDLVHGTAKPVTGRGRRYASIDTNNNIKLELGQQPGNIHLISGPVAIEVYKTCASLKSRLLEWFSGSVEAPSGLQEELGGVLIEEQPPEGLLISVSERSSGTHLSVHSAKSALLYVLDVSGDGHAYLFGEPDGNPKMVNLEKIMFGADNE